MKRLVYALLFAIACGGQGRVGCDPTLTCAYDPTAPEAPKSRLADECDRGCTPRFLSAGADHACANLGGDEHLCWGSDQAGQLGDRIEEHGDAVVGLPLGDQVSAGAYFSCAKIADRVACWGAGWPESEALLANGGAFVQGLTGVEVLAVGGAHICAIDSAGGVACAGDDTYGQAHVDGIEGPASLLALGGMHSCAVAGEDRAVYCWGDGRFGATGHTDTSSGAERVGELTGVTAIAAGAHHTCAIARRTLYCWGRGESGELGQGDTESSATPVLVALDDVVGVVAGGSPYTFADGRRSEVDAAGFTIALVERAPPLDADVAIDDNLVPDAGDAGLDRGLGGFSAMTFEAYVFGSNAHGQLLGEPSADVLAPESRAMFTDFVAIAAGGAHACVSNREIGLRCWGDDSRGQLGLEEEGDERVLETSMQLFEGDWPRRRRRR